MKKLKQLWLKYRHKRALQNIRNTFAYFGHDTSRLVDEDIERGVIMLSEAMRTFGISSKEASDFFARVSDAGYTLDFSYKRSTHRSQENPASQEEPRPCGG